MSPNAATAAPAPSLVIFELRRFIAPPMLGANCARRMVRGLGIVPDADPRAPHPGAVCLRASAGRWRACIVTMPAPSRRGATQRPFLAGRSVPSPWTKNNLAAASVASVAQPRCGRGPPLVDRVRGLALVLARLAQFARQYDVGHRRGT